MNTALKAFVPVLLLALAACGPSNEERLAAQRAKRMQIEATKQMENLKQLQTMGRDDLALNLANDIVARYPGTEAATQAKAMIEPLTAKANAEREKRRLQGLWVYHNNEDAEAGGVVKSAYLYSANTLGEAEPGKEAPKARLVLRRHPQWGDDVYLLTDRGHFACGKPCTVSVQFDDKPAEIYPGKLPETGEPAMFVEDFVKFVSALPEAGKVRFEVTLDDGSKHTPEFEVAEYNEETIGSPLRPQ
jgi:hypothetical protein